MAWEENSCICLNMQLIAILSRIGVNTDVRINGKNRTPLAVVTGILLWPCIFIPGSKAVMPAGYDVQATVASNTTVSAK